MTVIEAVNRLPEFRAHDIKTTRRVLSDLRNSGVIDAASLYQGRQYYFLPCPDDSSIDCEPSVNRKQFGPLSEQAKIRNFAILHHCCMKNTRRRRLSSAEIEQYFPDLHRPGLPRNYYITLDTTKPRLGFFRIDVGGRGRWDRVVAKCCDDLHRHWANQAVREFIKRDLFELTLITALPQKAARIQRTLIESNDPRIGMICVQPVPELLNLIAPPST